MRRDELGDWLRLRLTPGVGPATARRLLACFGLPGHIFAQPLATLSQVCTAPQAQALLQLPPEWNDCLERSWQWLQSPAADGCTRTVVTLGDANYPSALLNIEDPPPLLYVTGHMPEGRLSWPTNGLAIVGSRSPSAQGEQNARQFARSLREAGCCIVSGLALGVDGAAHAGALEATGTHAGPVTLAVVGTGLDRVYPKAHHALAQAIAQRGLIVSEFDLGTPALTANFPRRNRLIAGLSQATLVVEAALRSGSLITARHSVEQGKEVFAIPGSIHALQARGCHALIKQGAKLVESPQDVLDEWPMSARLDPLRAAPAAPVADEPGSLLEALGFDPIGLDALQARCGLDTATLQGELLALELEGRVVRRPGGLYQRLVQA
jgi:DNA processing protein